MYLGFDSIYASNSFPPNHILQCVFITLQFNLFSNILCDFFFDAQVIQKYIVYFPTIWGFSRYLVLVISNLIPQ